MSTITGNDITVIVRGLIVGADESLPERQFTRRSLESVRKHLPGARIVLSSWIGSNVKGLEYDALVLSEPPSPIFMVKDDGTKKFMAVNNQIIATRAALEQVKTPYVITMRSDMVIEGVNFLDYFEQFNQKKESPLFVKRILVLPTYNPRRIATFLFSVCDWFYFGLTDDIKKLFDVPLMSEADMRGEKINGLYPREENFEAEQYFWTAFLRRYQQVPITEPRFFSREAFELSEKSYAENLIMLPWPKAQLVCLKMPYAGYGARPILSHGLYTFKEYVEMYNKVSSFPIRIVPNPLELVLYQPLLATRLFLKNRCKIFYKFFVNAIRRSHGSQELIR